MTEKKIEYYIYFDKETKVYKFNKLKKEESEHKNYDFIKILENEWFDFIDTNPEVIKVENGKLTSHKRVKSLEELKRNALRKRKTYQKQTFEDWFDDVENMPQEIRDKRKKAKDEIKKIELISNKKDLETYKNF